MALLTRPAPPASRFNILMTLGLAAIVGLAGLVYVGIKASTVQHPAPQTGRAGNGLLLYESAGSLFVRSALGSPARQVMSGTDPSARFDAVWSPDGTRFAIELEGDDGYNLATIAADGTGIAALPATNPIAMAWSPDSSLLAAIDGTSPPSLEVVGAVGTVVHSIRLGSSLPIAVTGQPPEGTDLLVEAIDPSGGRDLLVTDPLGLSFHSLGVGDRLGRVAGVSSGAVYAPDGQTIAFGGTDAATKSLRPHIRIWLMGADGSDLRELPGSPTAAYLETPVAFSPDGAWLLVRRAVIGDCCPQPPTEAWLAIMPADGSAPARDIGPHFLTVDAAVQPAFSPDGTQILVGVRTDTPSVYSVDPATGASERLDWTEDVPTWQRVAP